MNTKPPLPAPHCQAKVFSFLIKKCNNYFTRKYLTEKLFPGKNNKNNILNQFDENSVNKLKTMYLKFPVSPKKKKKHTSKL